MCIQSSNNLGTVSGSGKASIPTQKLNHIPPSAPRKYAEVSLVIRSVLFNDSPFSLLHFSNGDRYPFSIVSWEREIEVVQALLYSRFTADLDSMNCFAELVTAFLWFCPESFMFS